jgi:UDP:flavonoid glycosyltransferase YjiC (YdhE family)
MARILFASELGANLGHVGQLLPLASELKARGHEIVFALRDVAAAGTWLDSGDFRYVQAPVWHARSSREKEPPCSYSEILRHYGYDDSVGLAALLAAWRELFSLVRPDVVLAEYAPTALLAARGSAIRSVHYGVGFSMPPQCNPFPNFRIWEKVPRVRLEASDAAVLETVNAALARLRMQALPELSDLLRADEAFLCTFRELDHYQGRINGRYWGAAYADEVGARAVWPEEGRKRVFVYLRPGTPGFESAAMQLSDMGHRVLWVAPRVTEELSKRFEGPRFRFTHKMVRIADVAAQAEAAVLHGGHGLVSAMLLGGVPLALFPMHAEQVIVARNVISLGAGAALATGADISETASLLGRVVDESRLRGAAGAFAGRYAHHASRDVAQRIALRVDQLAAKA